jgi:hypothetical protein
MVRPLKRLRRQRSKCCIANRLSNDVLLRSDDAVSCKDAYVGEGHSEVLSILEVVFVWIYQLKVFVAHKCPASRPTAPLAKQILPASLYR